MSPLCPYCHIEMNPKPEPQIVPSRETRTWWAIRLADCPRCGTTRSTGEEWELSPQEQMKYPSLKGLPERRHERED